MLELRDNVPVVRFTLTCTLCDCVHYQAVDRRSLVAQMGHQLGPEIVAVGVPEGDRVTIERQLLPMHLAIKAEGERVFSERIDHTFPPITMRSTPGLEEAVRKLPRAVMPPIDQVITEDDMAAARVRLDRMEVAQLKLELEEAKRRLEGMERVAYDRLTRIKKLQARVRPFDPERDTAEKLRHNLASALERGAFESMRADALHRALNNVTTTATTVDGVASVADSTLEEAEEVLKLSLKQRPRLSVTCKSCGTHHGPDEWLALKSLGLQEQADAPSQPMELRNCACGSTLAMMLQRLAL